jgi:hypothetical protein
MFNKINEKKILSSNLIFFKSGIILKFVMVTGFGIDFLKVFIAR